MNGVQILLVIAIGIAVSALAGRRDLQPGVFIVVLAAAASFIPGMPRLELDGELILALVIPPLLYSGARGAAVTTFGTNLRSILTLGVTVVVLTAGVLGFVANWLLPTIGLAVAFTLGSILAPPDTITTVSHGREIGLPKRVTSILTGESLVNDATALTLFSLAITAVDGENATFGRGVLEFIYTALVGIIIGAVLGTLTLLLRPRLKNPTLETSLVLLVPFIAFLLAEEVHASGILAVVTAAFAITINISLDPNHAYPGAFRTRLQEEAFWPVADFLLETFVFAYIGLQLKFVLDDLSKEDQPGLGRTLIAGGVLLVVAIAFRVAVVYLLFGYTNWRFQQILATVRRRPEIRAAWEAKRSRSWDTDGPLGPPNARERVLIGWIGMRGLVTLAAAAAVPELTSDGKPVPGHTSITAIALVVTLGTLLIQGTTIGAMIRLLGLDTAAEQAEDDAMHRQGIELAQSAVDHDGPLTDADFDAQRLAVQMAVRDRKLDEETARELVNDLDLRQAASHTFRE